MKKAVSIVGVFAAILLLYGGSVFLFASSDVAAADPKVKLYLAPAAVTTPVGSTVSMQVRVSKNTTAFVDYVNADMNFPAANLEVVSISKQGSYFSQNSGPTTAFSNAVGTISIKGEGVLMPIKADVLVATVTFKALKAGSANVSFSQKSQVGDMKNGGNVKNVMDAWTGSIVTISSAPLQPTPPTDTESDEETNSDEEEAFGDEEESGGDEEATDESDATEEEGDETGEEAAVVENDATNDDGELGDAPVGSGSGDDSSQSGPGSASFFQRYLWPLIGVGALAVAGIGWGATTLVMRRRSVPAVPLLAEESASLFGDTPLAAEEEVSAVVLETPAEVAAAPFVEEAPIAAAVDPVTPDPVEPVQDAPQAVAIAPPEPQPLPVAMPEAPLRTTAPHVAQLSVPDRPTEAHTPLNGADNVPDMFDVGEQRLQNEGLAEMKPSAHQPPR